MHFSRSHYSNCFQTVTIVPYFLCVARFPSGLRRGLAWSRSPCSWSCHTRWLGRLHSRQWVGSPGVSCSKRSSSGNSVWGDQGVRTPSARQHALGHPCSDRYHLRWFGRQGDSSCDRRSSLSASRRSWVRLLVASGSRRSAVWAARGLCRPPSATLTLPECFSSAVWCSVGAALLLSSPLRLLVEAQLARSRKMRRGIPCLALELCRLTSRSSGRVGRRRSASRVANRGAPLNSRSVRRQNGHLSLSDLRCLGNGRPSADDRRGCRDVLHVSRARNRWPPGVLEASQLKA